MIYIVEVLHFGNWIPVAQNDSDLTEESAQELCGYLQNKHRLCEYRVSAYKRVKK